MQWPVYLRDNLEVGNPAHHAAICTLWTRRDKIARALPSSGYAVIGNLYSRDGINILLRNILANPAIRYLIVCGVDKTGTGGALLALMTNGVDGEQRIVGDGAQIDRHIPRAALEAVRRSVACLDLRGSSDPARVAATLTELAPLPPFAAEPAIFPMVAPQSDTFPAEDAGMVIRAGTVAEGWLRAIAAVMRFGVIDKTPYAVQQKEVLDLVAIVAEPDPDAPYLPPWLPVTPQRLADYYQQFLSGQRFPELSYTYGERMFNWLGVDQVRLMIDDLRATPHSRRAFAALWDSRQDPGADAPPCLTSVQARLRGGRLFLTAYFRSHDIYRAWPLNALGLRKLQQTIAAGLGDARPPLGDLVIVSHSAHIYEDCWQPAHALLDGEHRHIEENPRLVRDPRGSFVVRVDDKRLLVDHHDLQGQRLAHFEGDSAQDVYVQLRPFMSRIDHALYLGGELQKAELAARYGWAYVQDQPLQPGP